MTPVLALLLYATFLGIPLRGLGDGLRDVRFLGCVLVVDFVLAPVVALAAVRTAGLQGPLLAGALLVLLAPCVDYVIAFTRSAGGAADRLLATAPVLVLVQAAALPLLLGWILGDDDAAQLAWGPFVEALVTLVLVPLLAAAATQWAVPRWRPARVWEHGVATAMVPLMMLTLGTVVASQIGDVGARALELVPLVPVYAGFAVVMTALGWGAGRATGLAVPERRAVVFTGVTRNSLVVLPLALAAADGSGLVPLAVVTQTLVELLVMVALVWLVPRLVPAAPGEG